VGKAAHQGSDRATKLRSQLASIVEISRPAWSGLLPKGRKEAKAGLPEEILQCFEEALLLDTPSDDVVDWWDRLSALVRQVAQADLLATGRAGERLTLRHESARTGKQPKWQSLETSYAGYDVLSVRSKSDDKPLKIEVKCSERPFKTSQIFITEHEWITANQSPETYIFHIWLVNPEPCLFTISVAELAAHAPKNQGKGMWRNACTNRCADSPI
jgi:hypothetical protein